MSNTEQLPALPEPEQFNNGGMWCEHTYEAFTEDQMKQYARDAIAALSAQSAVQEPLCWVPEDELPESMPSDSYNALYPHSRVDFIREFPIYGPHPSSAAQAAQAEEIRNAVNAALEKAAQICAKEAREWNSDAQISDKNYAGACTLQIRALKTTAPSKGEG